MRKSIRNVTPSRPRVAVLFTILLAAFGNEPGLAAAVAESEPAVVETADSATTKVSAFGVYEGYSKEQFSEWVNTSRYVEMRDGVKLAVDVTFPAVDGVPAQGKFPVVFTETRYHHNTGTMLAYFAEAGADLSKINSQVDLKPDLQRLIRHGYIVAAVQVRGGGASFGRYEGIYSEAETADAYEMVEWLATQPWSTGAIGMYGISYLAVTQYMIASRAPQALKAIFPQMAALDLYDLIYPGGVYRKDTIEQWGRFTKELDLNIPDAPVDEDVNGEMLNAARAEHQNNWDVVTEFAAGRYRDHQSEGLTWSSLGVVGVLEALQEARIPAYHWGGWFDIFTDDTILLYGNYHGPQKLTMGPWAHGGVPDVDQMMEQNRLLGVEQHRWFDFWLKGIDNGIMDEPPVHFAVMSQPGVAPEWVAASQWPVRDTTTQVLYFRGGPSGSVPSVNDGRLDASPGADEDSPDEYLVDLTTTTGTNSRWDNGSAGSYDMIYPDLSGNDQKSLTYTTGPLEADLAVIGHPLVTLWVTSSTRDGDFIVLLEEVDDSGYSHYVTEGVLRASHRVLGEAPWNNLGLPYQRSYKIDQEPLPADGPGELVMDLHPTANVFNRGHRLRLTIMGADADNIELPEAAPTIEVYRNRIHASRIELPVVSQP